MPITPRHHGHLSRHALYFALFALATMPLAAAARPDGVTAPTAPQRQVIIKMRLVRLVPPTGTGDAKEEVLQAPIVSTLDGTMAHWTLSGGKRGEATTETRFEVLPRLNADGTITLQLESRYSEARGEEDSTTSSVKASRRLQPGKEARIRGLEIEDQPVELVVSAREIKYLKDKLVPVTP